jgi:hypothetical protein
MRSKQKPGTATNSEQIWVESVQIDQEEVAALQLGLSMCILVVVAVDDTAADATGIAKAVIDSC